MTITIKKFFDDCVEMDSFIKEYLQEFAPAGYDTKVKIKFEQSYEEWTLNKVKYIVELID